MITSVHLNISTTFEKHTINLKRDQGTVKLDPKALSN